MHGGVQELLPSHPQELRGQGRVLEAVCLLWGATLLLQLWASTLCVLQSELRGVQAAQGAGVEE